ncbi:MAG: aldehyde ferredoxin oxidoreductase family protein [Candidatus Methanofastidiosia archaeon]
MKGYWNKLVRINLSTEKIKLEDISDDFLCKYIGGKGLGTKYLVEEVDPKIDPFSEDNKLIIITGPLIGTPAPCANRYAVFFKSPLTGGFAEAYGGGSYAIDLKKTGHDVLIIEGKASSPVYITITDNNTVEILDADFVWGKDTRETEDILKEKSKDNKTKIASIGPAGENLVKFACICSEYWRQIGRCGAGAVMGSKNLKAISVRGTQKINIDDKELFKKVTKKINKNIPKDIPIGLRGTPMMVDIENSLGTFPTRYWHKGIFEKKDKINHEAMQKEIFVKHKSCFACPIHCAKYSVVRDGKYKGTDLEGPEYETIYALGGLCEIADIKAIAKANDVCDRLGIDTMEAGNVIGFAMDAYDLGKLDSEFPIRYGDDEVMMKLLEMISYRRGIGNVLADGIKRMEEYTGMLGHGVQVKNLSPAGYGPRGLKGMALGYSVATRGACHLRSTAYAPESMNMVDRLTYDEKAKYVVDLENKLAVVDSFIICTFIRNFYEWEDLCTIYKAVTGREITKEFYEEYANNIISMAKHFNNKAGFTKKDDYPPRRIMEEPYPEGASKGEVVHKDKFETMLNEYYALRGWSKEGVPENI